MKTAVGLFQLLHFLLVKEKKNSKGYALASKLEINFKMHYLIFYILVAMF